MILVTGHKGFIGSRLTKELDARGYKWAGYDLKEGNDIRDAHTLDAFFEFTQPSKVIHLAALAGVRRGEDYREDYLSTNVMGTDNVLKMADKYGVETFVLFSSSSVYGENGMPNSFYGITKSMSELLPFRYDIPHVNIVVPYTVYGEDGRKDQVIYKWLNQIKNDKPITFYGDGGSSRTYTYVGDLVEGVIKAMKFKGEKIERFDFGGKEDIKLNTILEIFQSKKPDLKIDRQPAPKADVYSNVADISYAKEKLGYDPQTPFKGKLEQILNQELWTTTQKN
jgi:UDP-glucuronate 4-epimerase